MPEPKSPAPLRIGGASGSFWGDSSVGASQLVERGLIDVLVFDYLAEATMAILAAAQRKNPEAGYATDFIDTAMRQTLAEVLRRGMQVVSSAGGINPQACARALQALATELGLGLTIAVVEGDDLRPALPGWREAAPGGQLIDLGICRWRAAEPGGGLAGGGAWMFATGCGGLTPPARCRARMR